MEIRGSCVYSYEMIKDMARNNRVTLWLRRVVSVVCVLSLVFMGIVQLVFGFDGKITAYILIYTGLMVLYYYVTSARFQFKQMGALKDALVEFTFREEALRVEHHVEGNEGVSELRYAVLEKIIEAPRYFYFYQTKNQAFVVEKSTFSGGTAEELRQRIQPVLGKKYKIRKR